MSDAPAPSSLVEPSDRLLSLMSQWYEDWGAGRDRTPEELCPDSPQLQAELRVRIDAVKQLEERASSIGDAPADVPDQPLPGQLGDRYRVFYEIARGGMGAVFAAQDVRLRRPVAVKVMLGCHLHHASVRNRFVEEARITGQLQHPGVPPVHDLGELPDGRPFLVMKLIKGRTLAELLKERPDPRHDLPRFLEVFEKIAQTVAYAHSKGVIHRDLKPANVMVGAFGEVQVMDWGLAKVLDGSADEGPPPDDARPLSVIETDRDPGMHTQAGSVMGTLAYMPPEQARGEVERVGRPADVFALGAILCEVLTGRPAYTGTATEVRAKATLGQVDEALARLDACGADPELAALAKQCLSAEPAGRPADADEVARAVEAFRVGVEERARRAEVERAAAEARAVEQRKRRVVQVGLVASVALLAAAVGVGLWQVDRERRQREHERDQLVQQSEADKNQLAQRARYEQLQLVTAAVARLEGLRDLAAERPPYARTVPEATAVRDLWQRAVVSLDQSAHLLDSPVASDPSVADRVTGVRQAIPTGLSAADKLVRRTRGRVEKQESARRYANNGQALWAKSDAKDAISADPLAPYGYLDHGDYSCRRAEYDDAVKSYTAGLKLVAKSDRRLVTDLEVRIKRATILAGPNRELVAQWDGRVPSNGADACDLAEHFLIEGHYERAVRVFERAFESDPGLVPKHRYVAALAATLGGCGLGNDYGLLTPARRQQLRELADRWLPPPPPMDRFIDDLIITSIVKPDDFDLARYRFVRSALPARSGPGPIESVYVASAPGKYEGITIPGEALLGSPYPGEKALRDCRRDGEPTDGPESFLRRVLLRHMMVDLAADALRGVTSGPLGFGLWQL